MWTITIKTSLREAWGEAVKQKNKMADQHTRLAGDETDGADARRAVLATQRHCIEAIENMLRALTHETRAYDHAVRVEIEAKGSKRIFQLSFNAHTGVE